MSLILQTFLPQVARYLPDSTSNHEPVLKRSLRIPAQLCREVAFYDLLFGKFTVSVSRLTQMFANKSSRVFLGLGFILLFVADPSGVRDTLGPGMALLLWIGAIGFYIAMLFVVVTLLSFTQSTFGRFPIYAPVTSSLIFLIVFVSLQTLIETLAPPDPSQSWYVLFFNITGAGLAIETLFIRFVMPGIFSKPTSSQQTPDKLLKLGDQQLPLADVIYMAAQEHHVQIALPTGTITVRGRLGDAVAQTIPDQGIKPHRSWWVSARAQPMLIQQNGRPALRLIGGTIVPVAKTRQADIQQWLDRYPVTPHAPAAE